MPRAAYSDYDQEVGRPYYYCPFCRRREFAICEHAIYFWDGTNGEVCDVDDDLEKAVLAMANQNPSAWVERIEHAGGGLIDPEGDEESEDTTGLEIRREHLRPAVLEAMIVEFGLDSVIPSFQMVEVSDTDCRSYYGGNTFGLANKRDVRRLRKRAEQTT